MRQDVVDAVAVGAVRRQGIAPGGGLAVQAGGMLFGLLAVAMFVEIFFAAAAATQDGYWGDVFGAVLMTILFGWIFWLFGTSRLKEL